VKPIAILEHSKLAPAHFLDDAITAAGLDRVVIKLYDGEPLPDLAAVRAVVSLGGPMGAYDETEFPFLVAEKELLREAVGQGMPVLGICLGCQMLATALGGSAYAAPLMEVEFGPLQVSAAGVGDAVVETLAEPVLSFHGDTWDPPPGAEILAMSDRFPHAFRLGSALGIQPHPEVSSAIVRTWVEGFGRAKLEKYGVNAATMLEMMAAGDAANQERAARLFGAWLAEVVATTT
jgi:GMP synthase (glutamine-hydrolysing)